MDRAIVEEHLAQARRHIALGQKHIKRQTELIGELERDGHDAAESKRLLDLFKDVQAMHVAYRDRLLEEIGQPIPKSE
jgi:hypothetical protein